MATVIEAAGNLVFTLIVNSIRDVYLQRLEPFRAIVARPRRAAAYDAVAAAIDARATPTPPRGAMTALAARAGGAAAGGAA